MQTQSGALLRLAAEIGDELGNLQRVVAEGADLLPHLAAEPPASIHLRAAGSVIHDFCCGAESVLRRVGQDLDGGLPEGADWHRQLLTDMALEIPGLRPAVVSASLRDELDELRAFRHVFRNVYGFALKPARVRDLLGRLPEIFEQLRAELSAFAAMLRAAIKAAS